MWFPRISSLNRVLNLDYWIPILSWKFQTQIFHRHSSSSLQSTLWRWTPARNSILEIFSTISLHNIFMKLSLSISVEIIKTHTGVRTKNTEQDISARWSFICCRGSVITLPYRWCMTSHFVTGMTRHSQSSPFAPSQPWCMEYEMRGSKTRQLRLFARYSDLCPSACLLVCSVFVYCTSNASGDRCGRMLVSIGIILTGKTLFK